MNISKFKFISVSTLLLVLLGSTAMAAEEITVFSGRSDKFIKPVVKAFTKSTGIKVVIHSGKATSLLNKLRVEGKRTDADLFISNDAGTLQKGDEMGLFAAIPESSISFIPANYRAANNTWVGVSARARVLVVNTNLLAKNPPQSVFDLSLPQYKDKLAITNSSNESYIAGTTVYMQLAGKDKTRNWLAGMKSNVAGKVFNKHSKIVKAVASGKKAVGLVNHYYIYRHLAKAPDAPIKIILPDQNKDSIGVAWNVAGAAVSKFTKHPAAAQKFIEFLVSKSGQEIFSKVNSEYPTRPGVATDPTIPVLTKIKVADIRMSQLGKLRNDTIDLVESVGMP